MRNSGQILHLPALTFLLCWNPLDDKIEPLSDRGQERVLDLQHDVIPCPPLEGVEDVETL